MPAGMVPSTMTSLDIYVRDQQLALARSIRHCKKVYLDLRYWLRLRDVTSGALADPAWRSLLEKLQRAVRDGKAVCPIAESTFMELTKQSDPATRATTAQMVDSLSTGVALLPIDWRTKTEIAHFFHTGMGTDLHPLANLMWTKLSYVLGFQHPSFAEIDSKFELEIQKRFFDKMWTITLAEMVETIGGESADTSEAFERLAVRLNQENAAYAEELKSFSGTYKAEIRGVASICAPIVAEVIEDISHKEGRAVPKRGSLEWCGNLRKWERYLQDAFMMPQTKLALRTMHIQACLHAHIRWDKKRQFEANDFYDFNHAAAALGYCDAFFTERSLADLARRSNTALTAINGCRVTHRVEEAMAILDGFA